MRPLHILFAILVAILWGANFVAAKFGVAYFPPFLVTCMRFCLVAALMLPFIGLPTLRQCRMLLPVAVLSTLHFSLLFVALYLGLDIPSTAIIGQLGVPFACLLGAWFFKDQIGFIRWGGIAVSFSGIFVVVGTPNIMAHLPGFYLCLGSTLCWGLANIMIKRVEGIGSMRMLGWVALLNIPLLFGLSVLLEKAAWPAFAGAPLSAWLAILYTALASTMTAWGLWYFLLSRYTVSQVTPFSLLVPIFGIAFGQMFFQEMLSIQVILGGIITIAGVAVIVLRRPKTFPLAEAT